MKASSIKYLTSSGLKNMWVNKLMTIASVGTLMACMLIIGVAMILSVNVANALKGIEDQNIIMVYFNDRNSVIYGTAEPLTTTPEGEENDGSIPYDAYLIHSKEEALAVVAEIEKLDNVQSATYVSKEELLASMQDKYLSGKDEINDMLTEDEYSNPLSDGARIVVDDMSKYGETVAALKEIRGVTTVTAQEDIANKIEAIGATVKTAGFWIIAVLLLISLVIVSNTIRVTMYNRKLEISIMKAVGATDAFVRLPFVIEGMCIGVLSSLIAFGAIYLMQTAVGRAISETFGGSSVVPFGSYALDILLVFLAIGVGSGVFGSLFMMSKYLRKEGSEFRAL